MMVGGIPSCWGLNIPDFFTIRALGTQSALTNQIPDLHTQWAERRL
jgi:hypothetical protein